MLKCAHDTLSACQETVYYCNAEQWMLLCRANVAALSEVAKPDQARELEAALRDGPDLAGMAFVVAAPPAVADAHAATDPAAAAAAHASSDSLLLLRLGFLGEVAVSQVSMPWAPALLQQQGATAASSLGCLLGPRHSGAVPGYIIGRPPKEVRSCSRVHCRPSFAACITTLPNESD